MSKMKRGAGQSARPAGGLSAQHTGCAGAKPATERSDRRGAVIMIRRGDPEISGAIAEGMLAARAGVTAAAGTGVTAAAGTSSDPASRATVPRDCRPHPTENSPLDCFPGVRCPRGEGLGMQLPREQVEVVEAEIDRQHIVASLVRVAVGNDKTPEDYSLMVTKVRGDCARYSRAPGPVRRALRRVLGWYGLLCWAVAGAYHSQERLLGARR